MGKLRSLRRLSERPPQFMLARFAIAPIQDKGECCKHHRDGNNDQNAIEGHRSSPGLMAKSLAEQIRK
jgi:hypothetical protein